MAGNNRDYDITVTIHHHAKGDSNTGAVNPVQPNRPPKKRKKNRSKNAISIIILCFCFLSVISCFSSYATITPSTHARLPLIADVSTDAGFYDDTVGLIDNDYLLLSGMREFYKTTGVAPYLYITNSVDGISSPTAQQLDAFAAGLYDTLFDDQSHLLYVFVYTGGQYMETYYFGTQAATVIDAEAGSILSDYVSKYYDFDSYSTAQKFGKAFSEAGDHMMSVTLSPWVVLIVCLLASAVVIWLYIRRRKKEKAALKAQETEQLENLLKVPLEKFEDQPEYNDKAEMLARNYDDDPTNDIKT